MVASAAVAGGVWTGSAIGDGVVVCISIGAEWDSIVVGVGIGAEVHVVRDIRGFHDCERFGNLVDKLTRGRRAKGSSL